MDGWIDETLIFLFTLFIAKMDSLHATHQDWTQHAYSLKRYFFWFCIDLGL